MLAFLLLIFGIISRFVVHLPNFTPVVALALFSGTYLPKRYAVIFPLSLMIISDFFIGFHDTILFTWGSVVLISILGFWTRRQKTSITILSSSLLAALIFFVLTNFGTWLCSNLYPRTRAGLKECFILAIPFFRTTLLSTVIYTFVIFGLYEIVGRKVKETRWERVLLKV